MFYKWGQKSRDRCGFPHSNTMLFLSKLKWEPRISDFPIWFPTFLWYTSYLYSFYMVKPILFQGNNKFLPNTACTKLHWKDVPITLIFFIQDLKIYRIESSVLVDLPEALGAACIHCFYVDRGSVISPMANCIFRVRLLWP